MRGTVYYQTSILVKEVFQEGAKKIDRVNPSHVSFGYISSFKSMDTYRSVWNNLFNYLAEHFRLKNCELITYEHIQAYFLYKVEYYPSIQYAEKIVSAIMKLEFALNKYSKNKYENPILYDFSELKSLLSEAKKSSFLANKHKSRCYTQPYLIIEKLESSEHKLAALIQLQGGARSEAVTLIRSNQLKGIRKDEISKRNCGVILTKEKGGKEGDVLISVNIYKLLENYFEKNNTLTFKIRYQNYVDDIRQACVLANENKNGSHGFRWTFARNRVREYQECGYTYAAALQGVSWEMKHFRANITEHYLG